MYIFIFILFYFFIFLYFILFYLFILISWRLINLQYCSGFCHTLTWISLGFTCIPHPDPPSHLPLHPIPLGLPSAPGPSTCLKITFVFESWMSLMCFWLTFHGQRSLVDYSILQSTGLQRVRHDWVTNTFTHTYVRWRSLTTSYNLCFCLPGSESKYEKLKRIIPQ